VRPEDTSYLDEEQLRSLRELPFDELESDGRQLDVHICSTEAGTDRVPALAGCSSERAAAP
jgi:hypothetical protein